MFQTIKRLAVLTALFLAVLAAAGAQDEGIDYNQRIVEVLEGYQRLLLVELDDDVEDHAGRSWSIVRQAIERGYLRFSVNPAGRNVIDGTRFRASPENSTVYIIFDAALLEAWGRHPSITYAEMTRSVREAAGFFVNPDAWLSMKNDGMENFFLKIEGYEAEASLIRERLEPSGYDLTPYEVYVRKSFETDQLISTALFMELFSLPVAQGLYDLRLVYERNRDADALRETVSELGKSLLEARDILPTAASDEEVFPRAVAIHTWLEFTPLLIARIHNADRADDPLDFGEILARESDYAEIRRRLEASRTRDMPMMNHVARETRAGFDIF